MGMGMSGSVMLHRKVLSEVARMAFEGVLQEKVPEILQTVVSESGPRYRCCIHKERAVIKNRITLDVGRNVDEEICEAVEKAMKGEILKSEPILNVLPEACDRCQIDKFYITDACRNCVAHTCMAVCPKRAVSVIQNRAYIDQEKCVECSACKKACPFGAIIEVNRPCQRACSVDAVIVAEDRKAVIDSEKCVECGACKVACPFGAIADRSFIVPLINDIKAGKEVYAMVAPAFIGQFGPTVSPKKMFNALKKIGFTGVYEVALGADMVTLFEAEEFLETVPSERKFMTTSCCPAFADLIRKHMPEFLPHMSSTTSPMVATAELLKKDHPDSVKVFIGPCSAKKSEAKRYPDLIDYVITYEELAAMLVGAGINVTTMPEDGVDFFGSKHGAIFGRAGGVFQAVEETIRSKKPDVDLRGEKRDGLFNCKAALLQLKAGKLDANLFEGMACFGGCVGGPGTLMEARVTTKMVDNFAKTVPFDMAEKNTLATTEVNNVDMHRK